MKNVGLDLSQIEDYSQKQFSTDADSASSTNPSSLSSSSSSTTTPATAQSELTTSQPLSSFIDPNSHDLPYRQHTNLVDDNGVTLAITDPFPDCGDFLNAVKLSEGNSHLIITNHQQITNHIAHSSTPTNR